MRSISSPSSIARISRSQPAFGEFVVGDHIGALLRRGEMVETDNRHVSKVFQLRCLKTPMAGNNHIGVIDKHGV
jgi:hypothetical protein